MGINIIERMNEYDKEHCWQYDIRLNNIDKDIQESGLSAEEISNLKISDFIFKNVIDKKEHQNMIAFIKRHEWLGNISQFPTHWFGAYYKDKLAGVIIMNMPNAFSKMLGEETKNLERLVSRGACISWSPRGLASAFLMWSIKWMVKNTRYRLFTAYSDPTAKELGTIYQACNWYYVGQNAGTTTRHINPYTGKIVSDRAFRARSFYKKYAKELNIVWQPDWNNDQKMLWENVPKEIEQKLRDFSKYKQSISEKISFPSKHKYAYVLGVNKMETKKLRREFKMNNKIFDYPKQRGV